MSKQMQKGTSFERQVADYLNSKAIREIDRRVNRGANDTGDISGVYHQNDRVVIECKNHKKMELSSWLDEAEKEKQNDGARWCFVVHKRRGCGDAHIGKTYVTMTLEQLSEMMDV